MKIEDSQGKEILKNGEAKMTGIENGKAVITLSLDSLPEGSYKLIVNELAGNKKADSPLKISGTWIVSFEK